MHADLLLSPDLGGKRVQAGFVAVGNGKIARPVRSLMLSRYRSPPR
jgi:hypothetical protein